MTYTTLILALLGVLGIVIHNLLNLNKINKANEGTVNLLKYWKLERFSLALSVCVLIVFLIARTEVKQLEAVGKWLGLSFVAIGYMAQSIVIAFEGKTQKFLDNDIKE